MSISNTVIRFVRRLADEQYEKADAAWTAEQPGVADAYAYTARVLHAMTSSFTAPSAACVRRWAREERAAARHYLHRDSQYAFEANHCASILDQLADKLETFAQFAAFAAEAG